MTYIFVESSTDDKYFIEAIIKYLNLDINKFYFISTNGYTNLNLVKQEFDKANDLNYKTFVIFDADYNETSGGYTKRKKYLNDKKKELNIEFDLFLFPNNNDDGTLEDLLEKIVNPKHKGIIDCFENYENCLKKYKDNNGSFLYRSPIQKSKIFAYIDAFKKTKKQEEEYKKNHTLYLNSEYWKLNSEYLKPLLSFINKNYSD